MAHGGAQEGKWRGNWRMEWVASTLHTTSESGVSSILLPLMRTPRLPAVDWIEAPADLSGLVRFVERRNLVSARVLSHFKRSLPALTIPGGVWVKICLRMFCVCVLTRRQSSCNWPIHRAKSLTRLVTTRLIKKGIIEVLVPHWYVVTINRTYTK